jgi:hypothetical protein
MNCTIEESLCPPGPIQERELLIQIGEELDRDIPVVVHSGGVVLPSGADPDILATLGTNRDLVYESVRAREASPSGTASGSSTRPWEGSAPDSAATPGAYTPEFVQPLCIVAPVGKASEVGASYPKLRKRTTSSGFWFTGSLTPLGVMGDSAWIALSHPSDSEIPVRVWAWWSNGIAVGPRHTYLDASICAFEPSDPNSWCRSDGVTALIDLVSVWLVRHTYMNAFGRWPGRQRIHSAIERREQQHSDELCGCGNNTLYGVCHGPKDSRMSESQLLAEILVDPRARGLTLSEVRRRCVQRTYPRNWSDLIRLSSIRQPGRP